VKRTGRGDLDELVTRVETDVRPRRVPGRKVAVVPLGDLRRLRELEREAEDREDNASDTVAAARPDAYQDLAEVKARLPG